MANRSGAIPYLFDKGTLKMYFMIPSDPKYGGDKPQIAKGMIDEGETKETTAVKEAEEELGLKKDNIESIKYIGKYYNNEKKYAFHLFGIKIKKDDFNEPHYETKEVVCIDTSELHILRWTHINMVKDFIDEITRISK